MCSIRIWAIAALLVALPMNAGADTACTPAELSAITIHETTDHFEINTDYPVSCSPAVNAFLRDFVATFMKRFKATRPEPRPDGTTVRHVCDITYETNASANGRLLSVVLDFYTYTGGAHGNNWPTTWVFDLTNGRALKQRDIFEPAAYTAIREMVRDQLVAKLGDMYFGTMLEDGLTPDARHYDTFMVTKAGIRFLFPTYQVAPYAAGQQEAVVSWEKIGAWLTEDFRELIQ